MIKIEKIDDITFKVSVNKNSVTTHTVTIEPAYYKKLTGESVTHEELLKKSFEFLLQRESNTSIMQRFDLPVINRYFPEYERTITGMFK